MLGLYRYHINYPVLFEIFYLFSDTFNAFANHYAAFGARSFQFLFFELNGGRSDSYQLPILFALYLHLKFSPEGRTAVFVFH